MQFHFSIIYGHCTSDFAGAQRGGSVPSCRMFLLTELQLHLPLAWLQTQQKPRTSRLPTKRLLFFCLPESVLLMPTWYWCNKTRPDFYGNSPFFFSVYNIVRVETYPRRGNQRQFFVVKILWLFSSRKGFGLMAKFLQLLSEKKARVWTVGMEEKELSSSFLCCMILYICVFLPAVLFCTKLKKTWNGNFSHATLKSSECTEQGKSSARKNKKNNNKEKIGYYSQICT